METTINILFVLNAIACFYIMWWAYEEGYSRLLRVMTIGLYIGAYIQSATISTNFFTDEYKQGQIDAINGKLKYEQEIHYKQADGFIIPVDTIYNEIKP